MVFNFNTVTDLVKNFTLKNYLIIIFLALGCISLINISPPLKSPDEHDHIERAYLLNKGVLVLDSPEGKSSGGYVDSGLVEYLYSFNLENKKIYLDSVNTYKSIKWTGDRVYEESPGTGYYFPLIYFPQSLALWLGERLDLSVHQSYMMARLSCLFTILILLGFSFKIYPVNPLAAALIFMPMTLFQMSSASLDGISAALAIFAISNFLRISYLNDKKIKYELLLAFSLLILATSRVHAFPMLLLLGVLFFYTKKFRTIFIFLTVSLFVFSWTLFAMRTNVDLRVAVGASASQLLIYYILNPLRFFEVLYITISDSQIFSFYLSSFLGVLGWLEIYFDETFYSFLKTILFIIFFVSIPLGLRDFNSSSKLILLLVSIISILFIFFALLITWTPHPAASIQGVQGRYFLIPAIIFAYGFSSDLSLKGVRGFIATCLLVVAFVYSLSISISSLIQYYYMQPSLMHAEVNVVDSGKNSSMEPSNVLTENSPITLAIPSYDSNEFGLISKIGLLLGTYSRLNYGVANIYLRAKNGSDYSHDIILSDLKDNEYIYISVPKGDYVDGSIKYSSGGGVSLWQVRKENDETIQCINLLFENKKSLIVDKCRK